MNLQYITVNEQQVGLGKRFTTQTRKAVHFIRQNNKAADKSKQTKHRVYFIFLNIINEVMAISSANVTTKAKDL